MSLFRQPIQVFRPSGEAVETVDAWVDTGSTYTWLPRSLLQALDLSPTEEREFALADGRRQRRQVAQVRISLGGPAFYTYCAFAEPGEELQLGAVALEEAGLAVDPVNQRLVPATSFTLASR